MNADLLTKTYYQNTLIDWAIAFGIIISSVLIGKLVYWIFGNVFKKATSKTETKLDDMIVDMVEEPVVAAIVFAGIWYGLNTLTLPESLHIWIGKVMQLFIVLCVTWLAARLFDAVYAEYIKPLAAKTDTDLDDQLLPILRKLIKTTIWAFGLIIGLNNAGYDVAALLAGLGIGGLALAMAAKDTVSNIFGGFTILMDRPFKIGDRVKVAGHDGTIIEIGIRSTRLQTLEGRIVSIPNSKFSDSTLENVSLEPSRKVVSNLGLTYDTTAVKMKEAMEILRKLVADNGDVEDNTVVSFNAFGDSAMNILFIYYIKKGCDISGTQTDMNMLILEEFTKAGLDFAFPTQTLYTKTM